MTSNVDTGALAMRDASDADRVAAGAAVDGLLRCWVREKDWQISDDVAEIDLPATGGRLHAAVRYWSPTGQHCFGEVRLSSGAPVSAVGLAALLGLETTAARESADPVAHGFAVDDLVGRVADSQSRVAEYLRFRVATADETAPFLRAEQALVLGHPLHPAPKSRSGISPTEAQRFSPELRGSFPLYWFAADPSVLSGVDAPGDSLRHFAPEVPAGTVAIPAHPWQAREALARPGIRRLLDAGLLHAMGESGPHWYPTASVRTVYHPEAPVMLKFSLSMPITNSVRENLRKELRRGAEVDQLLDAGLGAELAARYPTFGIVRDPGWSAVDVADAEQSGLELVVRDNPFDIEDRVACVAGLCADRPDTGESALGAIVNELALSTGNSIADVAQRWCARYFDAVIEPVLWLYRTFGLGLEAHQQNTLVRLDEDGWPCGGWYRDNQGYYIAENRHDLTRFVPGVGDSGDNLCDEAIINERLGYYIGINNLLGLVGALGSQGIADERRLLGVLRERLVRFDDLPLARNLATAPSLRCKANLLTRFDGLDELVGPLETQSVYRDIQNPFTEATTA